MVVAELVLLAVVVWLALSAAWLLRQRRRGIEDAR